MLREKRLKRNLTQAQLAALLGVARPSVARWEQGRITPIYPYRKRLAELLGGKEADYRAAAK